MDFKLSILIPTLKSRTNQLLNVVSILNKQIKDCQAFGIIEILIDEDNREATTGAKRNRLIENAKGKYIVFMDDDDEPANNYISLILTAIKSNPDVIPINGYMSTNGHGAKFWDMGLGFGYGVKEINGMQVYDRFPNHIAPMKKELIKDFKFMNITVGEDYEWAKRINDSGILKTEVRITESVYHYKFIENK